MFAQQAAAQAQFQELQRRGLLAQNPHARRRPDDGAGRPPARPVPLGGSAAPGVACDVGRSARSPASLIAM